jgi:hypothetical protein
MVEDAKTELDSLADVDPSVSAAVHYVSSLYYKVCFVVAACAGWCKKAQMPLKEQAQRFLVTAQPWIRLKVQFVFKRSSV